MNFSQKVWNLISKIPRGKVTTYKEIARALGNPKAARAVGNGCNTNPNAPQVACHRVVSSSGKIGGYAYGVKKKIMLLKKEGIEVKNGKISDFENNFFTLQKMPSK